MPETFAPSSAGMPPRVETAHAEPGAVSASPGAGGEGQIGPNAVLQLAGVLVRRLGSEQAGRALVEAGIAALPDGHHMIAEGEAHRLHRAVRRLWPAQATGLLAEAGRATADYILAHRIPAPVQWVLRMLPAPLAAWLLARAIARHAWTFAGSGRFAVRTPWCFEIAGNPLIAGEVAGEPLCHWHAAVFERLYGVLVAPDCRCRETRCGARTPGAPCRFEIRRSG